MVWHTTPLTRLLRDNRPRELAMWLLLLPTALLLHWREVEGFSQRSSSLSSLYCPKHPLDPSCSLVGSFAARNDREETEQESTTHKSKQIIYFPPMDRRSAVFAAATLSASATLLSSPMIPSWHVAGASEKAVHKIPEWTLENGIRMPTLALNTVGLSVGDTERAIGYAVQQGVTHIDFHPGNERDGVAAFLEKHQRTQLFLNTKIRKAPPGTSPEDAAARTRQQIKQDLEALQIPQVDMLMLRDSPDCSVIQAQWAVLEEALRTGQTRSIGVINFCQSALECLLQTAKVKPAINYFMLHVGMGRDPRGLLSFGESRGIRTFAYGAVGEPGPNPELLGDPLLQTIGKAHDKTPEQVALRWILQSGAAVSVRPTLEFGLGQSTCAGDSDECYNGLVRRASSFSWSLTDKEMKQLDALTSPNENPTLFSSAGCPDAFVMPN